ncbi:hypothetical protein KY285_002408 [Solanum tuberosum]|nr:hypothetical protein KY285_002408 [Solanum tuberosum]
MGVLTHLDQFKDVKKLKKTKQRLKHRFWTEINDGAKLFYLSGLIHGKYSKREVHNLARFISVMKFPPLSWRMSHPYIVVDRFEDLTPPEKVCMDNKCDRNVILYSYLRGCNMKKGTKVHIAGVGDYSLAGITALPDPCPLPSAAKKKGLRDKEKLFYAPMSGLGDLLYDKDAVHFPTDKYYPLDLREADQTNDLVPAERDQCVFELNGDGSDEDNDSEDLNELEPLQLKRTHPKESKNTSDDSSEEEDTVGSEKHPGSSSSFREHVDFHDGRMRRIAIFDNDNDFDEKVSQ